MNSDPIARQALPKPPKFQRRAPDPPRRVHGLVATFALKRRHNRNPGSKTEQNLDRTRVHRDSRRKTAMPKQFQNAEATKLEDETVSDATAEKKINRVAEKAAEKASKTVKDYDKEHTLISH
jgi:hypothetical protein